MKSAKITIEIDVRAALNTDLIHWLMASVQGWNNQMPIWKMTAVSIETEGMSEPILDETKLRRFWDEWASKLPYEWNWKQ